MLETRTAAGGRRRATAVAGTLTAALCASAFTALPAAAVAAPAPVTSVDATLDPSLALDAQPGWSYATGSNVDFGVTANGGLRLSNARTSGNMTQLAGPRVAAAGEPGTGAAYDTFDAHFTVAAQDAFAPGLLVEIDPDNGQGSRTGGAFTLYDNPTSGKLELGAIWAGVGANDTTDDEWKSAVLAQLDPSVAHTVSLHQRFVAGANNDTVEVSVDGRYVSTVGTFENYEVTLGGDRNVVNTLNFRAGRSIPSANGVAFGTADANPSFAGGGFVLSDIGYSVSSYAWSGQTVHTTEQNLSAWDTTNTRATGHYELANDGLRIWTSTPTAGVSPSTDKSAAYIAHVQPLAQLGEPTWDVQVNSGQKPGKQIQVDLDGNGTPDGYLVGEDNFDFWWLAEASAWAKAQPNIPVVASQPAYRKYQGSLADWSRAFPQAQTLAVGYSLGSGAIGDDTIRSMTFGDTKYTFGHAVCDSTSSVVVRSLDALSSDSSGGSSVIDAEGLHVTTTSDADKQAYYLAGHGLPLPLRSVLEPSLTWTNAGDATAQPGVQLKLDVDGNGTWDGTLVGEPAFYGNDWWLPGSGWYAQVLKDAAPSSTGGFGSDKHGTLAQWAENLEKAGVHAQVIEVGFTLGRGPVGDGHISALSFGCTDVTFAPQLASTVTASAATAAYGSDAHVVVDVDASATATGTVTVSDGSTVLATGTLVDGSADLTVAGLEVGTHALTVAYTGDLDVAASAGTVDVTVVKAAATVVGTSAPAAFGTAGVVEVAVSSATGVVPTGTVEVSEGATVLGTATLDEGAASVALPASLSGGDHALTVSYLGDAHVAAGSAAVTAVVSKASAAITATVSKGGYSTAGTVDVVVVPVSGSGSAIAGAVASGTVTVSEGAKAIGSATLRDGQAVVTIPADLAVGKHVLTIAYSGDTNVAAGSTQAGFGVPLTASYVLSTDVEQVAGTAGQLVAVVVPGPATGTITVTEGSTTVGTATLEDGVALVSISKGLAVGTHTLTVRYSGTATVAASTTTVQAYVVKSPATVSATWSAARYGTAATVKVSVSGAAGAANGSVSVYEGSKKLASKSLTGGKATISLPKTLKVGTHKLSLRYSGSSTVNAKSLSKSLAVAKATSKSTVKLSSSKVKATKQAKASVKVTAAGVSVSGKVTVVIKPAKGKTITVKANAKSGKASVKLPKLKAGKYKVSVNFAGSSTVRSSVSSSVSLTVK